MAWRRWIGPLLGLALAACNDGGGGPSADGAAPLDASTTVDAAATDGAKSDAAPVQQDGAAALCPAFEAPYPWPAAETITIAASNAWKADITPDDPFLARPGEGPNWVKFAVFLRDPTRVYFQDSNRYKFHYDFATAHLGPLKGKTRQEFETASLDPVRQEVVLGAVLFEPQAYPPRDMGIELVARGPKHPELVERIVELVRSKVKQAPPSVFWFPTAAELACADAAKARLAQKNVAISGPERWQSKAACYSNGWGVGKLVALAMGDITAAVRDGRLTHRDILLVDRVPAELPHLAGILTRTPTSPNAHAVLLAAANQIPFAYLRTAAEVAEAEALVGQDVAVVVGPGRRGLCGVALASLARLDAATRSQLDELKQPAPIAFAAKTTNGALSVSTEALVPADVKFVGGKAAHYGLLRQSIPQASQAAIAFTFDLWDAFMAAPFSEGRSLGQEITARLAGFSYPPPQAMVGDALAGIRDLVRKAAFPSQLRQPVLNALAGFDPKRNIRFRSSSNVEDDAFVAAGLYDSYSGCLADDTDADERGPSLCDASEPDERGVFRAIKRVFASFYNQNAYLERLRHGVDESKVGMALLVHHSVPDDDELANGVIVYTPDPSPSSAAPVSYRYVSQPGAESVANPDGTALPEIIEGWRSPLSRPGFLVVQGASKLVRGETVLAMPAEYQELLTFMGTVAAKHAQVTGERGAVLDFEWKKVKRGSTAKLEIKQVRRLPRPSSTATQTAFLLPGTVTLCSLQTEQVEPFALHRLKTRWQLDLKGTRLDAPKLAAGLVETIVVDAVRAGEIARVEGTPANLPGFMHAFTNDGEEGVHQTTFLPDGPGGRRMGLTFRLRPVVPKTQVPLIFAEDLYYGAAATYPTAVPAISRDGQDQLTTTTSDNVPLSRLCADRMPDTEDVLVDRTLTAPSGVTVKTSFYWPPPPRGPTAGYTAPLARWKETRITGLLGEPIVLSGWFAQTYAPEHHNFGATYVFEPRLDPTVSGAIRSALAAKNVSAIHVTEGRPERTLFIGSDGTPRTSL